MKCKGSSHDEVVTQNLVNIQKMSTQSIENKAWFAGEKGPIYLYWHNITYTGFTLLQSLICQYNFLTMEIISDIGYACGQTNK